MAITTLLSFPAATQQPLFSQRPSTYINIATHRRCPSNSIITFVPLCSSSSASVVEDGSPPPSDDLLLRSEQANEVPVGGCKACGRREIEKGCNGEGRIQGGIATVPGFGWWPIKAYRPCPGFVASGGRYRRQGQSMDEVVSGGGKASISSSQQQ